jgi:hypothetical protein
MVFESYPLRWRTRLRRHLPWFLINLGVADKGDDCEAHGGVHEWFNADGALSACYHCKIERPGRLWKTADAVGRDGL